MEDSKKFPRICIVGAGLSGMCAGIQLKRKLSLTNFTIFDENHDFGGTWLINTYPKCGCDIPTIYYSYSFEPNREWTQYFSKQKEILAYLHNLAKKYDLYPNSKFNHQMQSMTWNQEENAWIVSVLNKNTNEVEEHTFDFIIAGPGPLQVPNIPEEYKNFKGPIFHSTKWDASVDLKDKTVAVIGSGTSAIQIIPGIIKDVKTLYSFQRNPAYVMPKVQVNFSQITKWGFKYVPGFQKAIRFGTYCGFESIYLTTKRDNVFNSFVTWIFKRNLKHEIPSDKKLRIKLTPEYPIGNRRIALSKIYLAALTENNSHVIREKVTGTTAEQIITEDGVSRKVDVIILATGFHRMFQSFFNPIKIYKSLGDEKDVFQGMRDNLDNYLGVMMHPLPNIFFILGPNTGTPYNSAIFQIECQVGWIIKVIRNMIENKKAVVLPTIAAQDRHMRKTTQMLEKVLFGTGDNMVKDKSKVVNIGLFPGSQVQFWRLLRKVKYDDLKIY